MNQQERKAKLLFLFSTSSGLPFLLHPFGEVKPLRKTSSVEGRYGIAPEMEATVLIRNLLYEQADREIQEWMSERNFLPRFGVSILIFFVCFFVMAWVIRDVIPLVDELLVSIVASLASYYVMGKKSLLSSSAVEEKIKLKKRIDTIHFTQKNYLIGFEKIFRSIHESKGIVQWNTVSSQYNEVLKELSNKENRWEITQLAKMLTPSSLKAKRYKKLLSNGRFPRSAKREEQIYLLAEALLMGFAVPRDPVQTE